MTSTAASEQPEGTDSAATRFGLQAAWLDESRWDTQWHPFGIVVLFAVLAAFWQLSGTLGVVAWFVVALSWVVFPPIVPVAIGQFALVALTAADTGFLAMLPVEATLGGLLLADVWSDSGSTVAAVSFTGVAVLSVATILALNTSVGFLGAIVGFVVLFGAVSYLSYRLLLDLDLLLDDVDRVLFE